MEGKRRSLAPTEAWAGTAFLGETSDPPQKQAEGNHMAGRWWLSVLPQRETAQCQGSSCPASYRASPCIPGLSTPEARYRPLPDVCPGLHDYERMLHLSAEAGKRSCQCLQSWRSWARGSPSRTCVASPGPDSALTEVISRRCGPAWASLYSGFPASMGGPPGPQGVGRNFPAAQKQEALGMR